MIFTENRYDRSIERMMKGVPNFYPRSSGIVVTGNCAIANTAVTMVERKKDVWFQNAFA